MHYFKKILQLIFSVIFFPIFLLWTIWKDKTNVFIKLILSLLIVAIILPAWILGETILVSPNNAANAYLTATQVNLPTTGPSMLPTLSESDHIRARRILDLPFYKYKPSRGDIIIFNNAIANQYLKTSSFLTSAEKNASGLVKRVIGLPGDKILIKDGFVYLNQEILEEPYILKPRSTFGGKVLKDCQPFQIPEDKLLVLGDNRKESADSRHLGLISFEDIMFYRPLNDQKEYLSRWRDATHDKDSAQKPSLDVQKYLDLINEKRKAEGIKPLKYQEKLAQSALKRAKAMVRDNDFSFEATKSGYTMEKAMEDVNYSNIVWGETHAIGYYDADELLKYYFEFPEDKKFLLNKDFEETGISATIQNLNGCPMQVIVQHLAGYKPPNYKKEDIDSWKSQLENLNSAIPTWEKAQENSNINQTEVKNLLSILNRQKLIASTIVSKMEGNIWLTKEEQGWVTEYSQLNKQSSDLAQKLNDEIKAKNKQSWDNYLDECIKTFENLEKTTGNNYESEKQKCRDNYNTNAPK